MTRRVLHAGDVLFHESDTGDVAYLVERGRIQISLMSGESEVKLADLGPGDLVGEMALIDNAPRTATAVAVEESVLLVIDREHLAERIAHTDPIVRALLGGQIKRYRAALTTLQGGEATSASLGVDDAMAIAKIRLESQLREALEGRRLQMHLQPLLDIPKGQVAGYEALVRWNHPERGPISPLEFITLAEETSLIVPVGQYVLEEAIAALVTMRDRGVEDLPFVSINVSSRQLGEAGLIDSLLHRLKDAKLPNSAVKLEITESQVLDYAGALDVLEACRAAGIRVALDDFGTGFSNLSHLSALAFDTVKIDQAFLRNVESSGKDAAMLEAIVGLVRATGADALAEGVETEQQLDSLRRLGVRYAQGYLIGKPQPLSQALSARGL